MTAFLMWACISPLGPAVLSSAGRKLPNLWASYLSSLPREEEMTCLLSFVNDEELSELQLTHLKEEAVSQREWVAFLHKRFFDSKKGELRSLRLAEGGPKDTFWAASMVLDQSDSAT